MCRGLRETTQSYIVHLRPSSNMNVSNFLMMFTKLMLMFHLGRHSRSRRIVRRCKACNAVAAKRLLYDIKMSYRVKLNQPFVVKEKKFI